MTIWFTQSNLPSSVGREPASNSYWPVVPKRSVTVPRIGGDFPSRGIGARRSNGTRTHCGIDIFARYRDKVVAIEDGQIVSFYRFAGDTYALFVKHNGFVVNYGELDKDSLSILGLKTPYLKLANRRVYRSTTPGSDQYPVASEGSTVKAGQQIGIVGLLPERSSMLHVEFYSTGIQFNKKWKNFPNGAPPSGLLNPTDFMVTLSSRNARITSREESSSNVCR